MDEKYSNVGSGENERSNGGVSATCLGHVSIKTPDFMETAVNGWFSIIEAQFHLKSVSVSATKFYHVISALPAEVVARLPVSIFEQKNYDCLKEAVVTMYEGSKPEMLDKLMNFNNITGRPSVFLQEMTTLANRIGVGEQIVRHKFLQSIPSSISPVIASRKDLSLQELGRLADELLPYFDKTSVLTVESTNHNSQSRQRSPTPSRYTNNSGMQLPFNVRPFSENQKTKVCRAHLYFAEKAKTCKPWCRWPDKNRCTMQPNSRSSSPIRSSEN